MATSSTVKLVTSEPPSFYKSPLSQEFANKTSQLLQENHEKHHIFFNDDGFHNHIVHHLLTIYSLGANEAALQRGYDNNETYQRPNRDVDESLIKQFRDDPSAFKSSLGRDSRYPTFLIFFQREIAAKGVPAVVNEYLFAGDERADDLFARLFGGFLHPFIHLGFGIEFQQPAIVAEALAQTAVHGDWMGKFLFPAEKAAKENAAITNGANGNVSNGGGRKKSKTLVDLIDEIRADAKLSKSAHYNDGNKIRDGVIKRAGAEMVHYASQFTVNPDELQEKAAEATNAAAYFTSAALRPNKKVRFDFFYMHSMNSSIFLPSILNAPWLSDANKARLLEWKARSDLALYVSRGTPPLLLDEVRNYRPKKPSGWDDIFARAIVFEDDGHASKLVRAAANGEKVCGRFLDAASGPPKAFRILSDDWLQFGHMIIDAAEDGKVQAPVWVRNAGMDEAWVEVGDREQANL